MKYPVEDPNKPVSLEKRIEERRSGVREARAAKRFGLKYPVSGFWE